MRKFTSLFLVLVMLCVVLITASSCTDNTPDRVHVYGDLLMGSDYVRGNVCFKVTDYNKDTNQVKILGLEQYGWFTLFNYDFYTSSQACPSCGHQYATIH